MKKDKRLHYLAVLIVFLTFVTREILHEHWRELADSIERAEQEIEIRGDISRNYAELRGIEDNVTEISRDVIGIGEEQREIKSKLTNTPRHEEKFEKITSKLLGEAEVGTDDLQSLATQVVLARSKLQSVGPLTRQLSKTREIERLAISKDRNYIQAQCMQKYDQMCIEGLDQIGSRTSKFVNMILKEADEKRDSYGNLSNIFGWLGIVLFTCGSVVAMFTDEKVG